MRPAPLPLETYDNIPGKLALSLLDGEDASGLLMLIMNVFMVKIGAVSVRHPDGTLRKLDMLPESVLFLKPYSPQTKEIVDQLETAGFISLAEENSRGCSYTLLPDNNPDWANRVFKEMLCVAAARRERARS